RNPRDVAWPTARLLGYDLQRLGHEPDGASFSSSDTALLTLFWRATAEGGDGRIAIHLRDSSGSVARERVVEPVSGRYPFSSWVTDEVVRDPHKIPLDGLAPGRYSLAVALLDANGHPRTSSGAGGDGFVALGSLEIK
ncbi:MAG TPA: hypothetical protein VMP10_02805, partial [Chloroflexota bacterium]|nr:hypothetical protein [Chloroflexota bacterium]